MHFATPIRERNEPSQANHFGFCTYAPCAQFRSATLAVSADTFSPRICAFRKYLNFNPFNRYALAPPISFRFCRYKNRGEGDMTQSKQNPLPAFASLSRLTTVDCGAGSAFASHGLSLASSAPSASSSQPRHTVLVTPFVCILADPVSLSPFVCILTNTGRGGTPTRVSSCFFGPGYAH